MKFGKTPLMFTQVIIRKQKYENRDGHTTDILMFTKVFVQKRKHGIDMWQAYNSVKNRHILFISRPKPTLHNINVQTKFTENPLTITHYHPETKLQMWQPDNCQKLMKFAH